MKMHADSAWCDFFLNGFFKQSDSSYGNSFVYVNCINGGPCNLPSKFVQEGPF
jgi:hypothetical protein